MKKGKLIYCMLFFSICLFPLVGMIFLPEQVSHEEIRRKQFPLLKTENGINKEWLEEAGDYFQEHFAFRNQLITADSVLKDKVLGTFTAFNVIHGTDGWLYYQDSLNDYMGTELLSDRSIFNVAHTLSMMQTWLENKGIKFVFTVAPNKNSLYGGHMPYYNQVKASDEKNILRLAECLEEEGVSYVDLYGAFSEEEEVLYHKKDSHWNNQGAALAADKILTALGKEHDSYENVPYEIKKEHKADLLPMLYPSMKNQEEDIYYEKINTFACVGEVKDYFDTRITTVNPSKDGSLVMYRDSFGNALLPFMADAYGDAYFSRGVPYQMSDVDTTAADTLVVERAERFIPEMAQTAPYMEGMAVVPESLMVETAEDGVLDLNVEVMGMVKITGRIKPEYMTERSKIYIRINQAGVYEAFPVDLKLDSKGNAVDENGFCLYLNTAGLKPGCNIFEVIVKDETGYQIIFKDEIEEIQ